MKFFVDANLPFKLALNLRDRGFDALHTDDLPDKERTTDKEIRKFAIDQDRIVITKDSDFLDLALGFKINEDYSILTDFFVTNNSKYYKEEISNIFFRDLSFGLKLALQRQ